jgi:hypothetical protein
MTGKRFELNNIVKKGTVSFWDKKKQKILNASHVLDELNNLNNENEQLTNELNTYKEANKTLKQTIDRILTDNIHYKTKLNEQMKKEYKKNE